MVSVSNARREQGVVKRTFVEKGRREGGEMAKVTEEGPYTQNETEKPKRGRRRNTAFEASEIDRPHGKSAIQHAIVKKHEKKEYRRVQQETRKKRDKRGWAEKEFVAKPIR